jgi:NADP-dependent 3-hydroxy acid dehydrogenase YdfG
MTSLVGEAIPSLLQVSLSGKSVLITGCDSGFGYELALRLEKMVGKTFL